MLWNEIWELGSVLPDEAHVLSVDDAVNCREISLKFGRFDFMQLSKKQKTCYFVKPTIRWDA